MRTFGDERARRWPLPGLTESVSASYAIAMNQGPAEACEALEL
jgi:hypothetical protein